MTKDIKDYLHYYPLVPVLICEPGLEPVSDKLEGVDWLAGKAICERVNYDPSWIKINLRSIQDMTVDECVSVYTIEQDGVLHLPTNDFDVRRGDGCWKIVRIDLIDTTLFITDNAIIYKVTEDSGKPMIEFIRNLPEVFHYLLGQKINLFNLPHENTIIDKTPTP